MSFGEGVHNEQDNQKGFVPSGNELREYSKEQTEVGSVCQKKLQDLESWRNNFLQKCEEYESAGKNCDAVRQGIEDEYTEKKFELLQRAYHVKHSA